MTSYDYALCDVRYVLYGNATGSTSICDHGAEQVETEARMTDENRIPVEAR